MGCGGWVVWMGCDGWVVMGELLWVGDSIAVVTAWVLILA